MDGCIVQHDDADAIGGSPRLLPVVQFRCSQYNAVI